MNPMHKFTAQNDGFGFTKGKSYYTADVLKLENGAFSCKVSDDRGTRYQINSDVPAVTANGERIDFKVAEVSSGNVQ